MSHLWSVCILPALLCAACAPVTRVTLLPGAAPNASVEVATAQSETRLTTPYREAEVSPSGHVSNSASSAARVRSRYGALRPPTPAIAAGTLLAFEHQATTLTVASQAPWASALQILRERPAATLHILSADRPGPLTAARLHALQTQAIAAGIAPERIQLDLPESTQAVEADGIRIFVR